MLEDRSLAAHKLEVSFLSHILEWVGEAITGILCILMSFFCLIFVSFC